MLDVACSDHACVFHVALLVHIQHSAALTADALTHAVQVLRVLRPEGVYLCISHGTPLMRLPYLRHESLLWHCSAAPLRATEGLTLFACTKCPPAQLQAARAARERELALQLLPSSPTAAAAAVLDGAVEFKHAVTRKGPSNWRPVNAIMRAAVPRDPRSEADRQEVVDSAAAAAAAAATTQASKQQQQQQPMLQITDNAAAVAVHQSAELLQQQHELQLKTLEFDAEALLLDSAADGEDGSHSDAAAATTDFSIVGGARAQRYSSSAAF
jgi:hypothetical protein